jgi:tetratricopeptide (TPR) repeat protein
VLAVALTATSARADTPPNIWDLAKNPNAYDQYARHLQIEREIDLVSELTADPQDIAKLQIPLSIDHARTIIEEEGPKDVWLRFDEGWVLMKREQWAQAIPILEEVAKELASKPFSQEVWERLAECYVRVERTDDEIRAYDEVLARAATDTERITPLLNQGEALMRSGAIDTAVEQFREVLRLSAAQVNASSVYTLAQWDLAVALDRSGDPRAGLDAARAAVRLDGRYIGVVGGRVVLSSTPDPHVTLYIVPPGLYAISEQNEEVYFVPNYERDWYLALGYEALALEAGVSSSLAHWRDAETHMMTYITQATLHAADTHKPDTWLDLGQKRLDDIRRRRANAQKQAGPVARDANGSLPL